VRPECQVGRARALGQTADRTATVFEVACRNGAGYIVDASFPISAARPMTFNNCMAYQPSATVHCTLTDVAQQDDYFATLVARIGRPCTPTAHRWVGSTPSGSSYLEVACQDGKGYMFEQKPDGTVGQGIDCAVADNIGGGCTLTNARAAQSQQSSLYTRLAHGAGFACDVSKYFPFETAPQGYEAVELACSNRPDGAVALFAANASNSSKVFDCAHSELVGFRCTFTSVAAAYPSLTADLNRLGRSSCTVSGERVVGVDASKTGYVEVACADGAPGFIVSYDTGDMTPKAAVACPLAKAIAGGCTLPANRAR
jgi:hypothetical protein